MFLGREIPVWLGHPSLMAVIVDPLQYVEEIHAQNVRSFQVMRSFHAKAAGTSGKCPANYDIPDSPRGVTSAWRTLLGPSEAARLLKRRGLLDAGLRNQSSLTKVKE
jgi:hypothetical protein